MQTRRWNKRHLSTLGIGLLLFYMIFSASRNTYKSDIIIPNTKSELVWEYVADFHKMHQLNPTILNFIVTKEEGHFNHWKYSIEYTERLSHWPYWINVAEADFVVKKLLQDERGQYSVTSDHRTCFLGGLYCLYSTGEFLFVTRGSDTYVVETVNYQCPPFFGPVCRREVEFQRKAIMQNLSVHFNKLNKNL
ncbi:uncharacterized protein LOC116346011 [Contarinia nasturtii]|uniref:uncharacterized protein LOC116346011 n=1 Tax=Contarinia nasturtii TaxID=265458 RepID=UPI0012D44BE8|nr:uncharacterized protein LOC116346011 [Contarinia nasturtii]